MPPSLGAPTLISCPTDITKLRNYFTALKVGTTALHLKSALHELKLMNDHRDQRFVAERIRNLVAPKRRLTIFGNIRV